MTLDELQVLIVMIHIAPPHTRADPDHINATSYTPAPSFPSMSSLLTEAILYSYIDIWAISSVYIFVCPPHLLGIYFYFLSSLLQTLFPCVVARGRRYAAISVPLR